MQEELSEQTRTSYSDLRKRHREDFLRNRQPSGPQSSQQPNRSPLSNDPTARGAVPGRIIESKPVEGKYGDTDFTGTG